MGATIYWKPVRNDGVHLDVGLRSGFVEAMNRAFGSYPWTLDHESIQVLRGMRAAWDGQDDASFQALLDAIATHRVIEVWPEY